MTQGGQGCECRVCMAFLWVLWVHFFWKAKICADKGRMTGGPVRQKRAVQACLCAAIQHPLRLFIVHIRLRSEIPPVVTIHCSRNTT
jgi:hypothetical protein